MHRLTNGILLDYASCIYDFLSSPESELFETELAEPEIDES